MLEVKLGDSLPLRRTVDWLALPHDVEAEPEEPVGRKWASYKSQCTLPTLQLGHPHRERWEEAGRRFKQRWQGEGSPPDDEEGHSPYGSCKVQVVRSVSDWSHGVLTENSIQMACMFLFPNSFFSDADRRGGVDRQLILEANHFIYIENQFL